MSHQQSTDGSDVVVVTGASAGVGRATARAFAEQGARVGLLARGEEGLEGARRDVEAAGGEALTVPTDVADADEVEAAADAVEEAFGPIDVWVNNAMTSVFSPVDQMEADEYERVVDVTFLGCVYGTLAALDHASTRRGDDHPGRVGTRVSRDSITVGVLWIEARDSGVHRLATNRVVAR